MQNAPDKYPSHAEPSTGASYAAAMTEHWYDDGCQDIISPLFFSLRLGSLAGSSPNIRNITVDKQSSITIQPPL